MEQWMLQMLWNYKLNPRLKCNQAWQFKPKAVLKLLANHSFWRKLDLKQTWLLKKKHNWNLKIRSLNKKPINSLRWSIKTISKPLLKKNQPVSRNLNLSLWLLTIMMLLPVTKLSLLMYKRWLLWNWPRNRNKSSLSTLIKWKRRKNKQKLRLLKLLLKQPKCQRRHNLNFKQSKLMKPRLHQLSIMLLLLKSRLLNLLNHLLKLLPWPNQNNSQKLKQKP